MTYRNIYIHPHGALAQARKAHDSRAITAYASNKLLQGGLDDLIVQTISKYQSTEWPKTLGADTQRLAVWVKPDCESYLALLAEKHLVSMPRITLVWMESAAHDLGEGELQHVTIDQPTTMQETHADTQANQPSAMVDTSAPNLLAEVAAEQLGHKRGNYPVSDGPHRALQKLLRYAHASVKALVR